MTDWCMVIDLDKCIGCQACSVACRMENNTPVAPPEEAKNGREIRWNDVYPLPVHFGPDEGEYPNVKTHFLTRPCMHCKNAPCVKVCPVQATYIDEEGIVHQNYERCIGCRFCTMACPYGVRYFNYYEPKWDETLKECRNPDQLRGSGSLEGPAPRPVGVVEKCTYCVHRLVKARAQASAEGREFRADEYVPACVQTCTGKARYFGDLDDPNSTVSQLSKSLRATHLLEDSGAHPKTLYLSEG